MAYRTQEAEYRPPLRHDSPNLEFRNLLVEVYQEREALLQRSPALIPGPQEPDTAVERNPTAMDAGDGKRLELESLLRKTTHRIAAVEPPLREPQRAQRPPGPYPAATAGVSARRDLGAGVRDHTGSSPEIGALVRSGAGAATK